MNWRTRWIDRGGLGPLAQVALAPLEALFRGVVLLKNLRFDWFPPARPRVPVISVGNLSVGGTGKTPVAAYFAQEFSRRGARPAIVLRGYGQDEPLVHKVLSPSCGVFVDRDRRRGIETARRAGHDIVILDDAFQHRRAGRHGDVVLVSAERGFGNGHCLPVGPLREPRSALGRATMVAVTRKVAEDARVRAVLHALRDAVEDDPVVFNLVMAELADPTGRAAPEPLTALRDGVTLAFSGLGDGGTFAEQLRSHAAAVEFLEFPDHYDYSSHDIQEIAARGQKADRVVCTLKDAVKVAPLWPAGAPPLWYVSLRVETSHGSQKVDEIVTRLLSLREHSDHHQ